MLQIVFEFVGGPMDGKTVTGVFGEDGDAERYYLLSNHGAIGQRIKVASDFAIDTLAREKLQVQKRHHFQQHYYVVTDRIEAEEEVLVRAEYVPQSEDEH